MTRKLIPSHWQTEHLLITDSTLTEAKALQAINDIVPQTQSWMQGGAVENPDCSMRQVIEQGDLPPVPEPSLEYFRLQSIRLISSNALVGFWAAYHGFPTQDVFWMSVITFHPDYQGMGYGPELFLALSEIVRELGCYTCMRSYVSLDNWPSLKLCIKVGMNKMLEVAGDPVHSDQAHILLEKTIQSGSGL